MFPRIGPSASFIVANTFAVCGAGRASAVEQAGRFAARVITRYLARRGLVTGTTLARIRKAVPTRSVSRRLRPVRKSPITGGAESIDPPGIRASATDKLELTPQEEMEFAEIVKSVYDSEVKK